VLQSPRSLASGFSTPRGSPATAAMRLSRLTTRDEPSSTARNRPDDVDSVVQEVLRGAEEVGCSPWPRPPARARPLSGSHGLPGLAGGGGD
jgi:hypothetical protein